jgi:hypothetical protein
MFSNTVQIQGGGYCIPIPFCGEACKQMRAILAINSGCLSMKMKASEGLFMPSS